MAIRRISDIRAEVIKADPDYQTERARPVVYEFGNRRFRTYDATSGPYAQPSISNLRLMNGSGNLRLIGGTGDLRLFE